MEIYFVLRNHLKMPGIGYGTYKSTDGNNEQTIRLALETGYRLLDTAAFYDNEELVGKAIRDSGIDRESIFLTSKVWKTELGYEQTKKSFEHSLRRLGTDYLDLFLIHWPRPDLKTENWKELCQGSWKALEEFYRQGKTRAIGVSNFLPHHLHVLMQTAEVAPMVDQLELHVGYMQEMTVRYCKENSIQVQAWSPLGRSRVLQHPVVTKMAEKYDVTPAQFLLKFLLQQEIAVIPKASSAERMRQNLHIPAFEIDADDLSLLRSLPQMGWGGEHPDLERAVTENH